MKKIFIILGIFVFLGILLFFGIKEKIGIVLYYYTEKDSKLIPIKKEIEVFRWQKWFRREDLAKEAILNLLENPEEKNYSSPIPKGTKLLKISIKNNVAYVSFSNEIKKNHPGGSMGEILTIYSIVNTLTEFPWIKKVQILVEGAVVDTLAGHMDISEPIERDLSLVK